MVKALKYSKPVVGYIEEVGYNYIVGPGQILYPGEWFKSATEFNDEGYAIVESYSKKKMRIDMNGNLEEITEGIMA